MAATLVEILRVAALPGGLAVAVLLAVAGWMAALEARSEKRTGGGETVGWICFAAVHTVAAVAAWCGLTL